MKVSIFYAFGLKTPIHGPKIGVWGAFDPLNGERCHRHPPKGTSLGGNTSYDVLIVKIRPRVWAGGEEKNKAKKRSPKKPKHVTCHVFAETTHVVAAPYLSLIHI